MTIEKKRDKQMEHTKTPAGRKLVKILVGLRPSQSNPDWPPIPTETIWAEQVGEGHFRVDNILWFARGLSYNDIVSVQDRGDNELVFDQVIARGGHSRYRIKTYLQNAEEHRTFHQLVDALKAMHCDVEKNSPSFFAIDVPPTSNVYAVYDLLKKGAEFDVWDFEEGHAAL